MPEGPLRILPLCRRIEVRHTGRSVLRGQSLLPAEDEVLQMFDSLIAGLKQLRDGLKTKDIGDIRKGFVAVVNAIDAVWDRFNGPPLMASNGDGSGEVRLLAKECIEIIEASESHPALNAAEMTAIGDGKFLQLVQLILPIVLKFII